MPLFRRGPSKHAAGDRWIVAGLGNPGDRYERTRHNAGAMVLGVLLERTGASFKRHKSGSLAAETNIEGRRVVLARGMTFMNESGRPLGELARWYRTPAEQFVVVHDEIDIPFGTVRIKLGGGTAGHNGLRSIESHLSTRDFLRVRVGVGRPRAVTRPRRPRAVRLQRVGAQGAARHPVESGRRGRDDHRKRIGAGDERGQHPPGLRPARLR